jgi:4-amino-4-deoxy-L-arabinose transferase-like glycosyltransferase
MIRAVAGRALAKLRGVPAPLALLLASALLLGTAWSLVTAPFQGFDETNHTAYALHLGQTGEPPTVVTGTSPFDEAEARALDAVGFGRMAQNPAVRPPWRPADEDAFRRFEARLPAGSQAGGAGPNPVAKNPPLFYALEGAVSRIAPGGLFTDVWAMRTANVLLSLAAVSFAWLLAAELFRRTLLRVVVAGVVALQPMFGQLSGIVNSDVLLTTAWLALTWLGVRTYRRGITPGRLVAIGGAAAACVLTHGRGIAAIPSFLLILLVLVLHHRPQLWPALRAALAGGMTLAAAVLVYRLYTAAATRGGAALYGGEASFTPKGANPREFLSFVWQFYFPRLETMAPRIGPDYGFRQVWVQTFFGSFGSYEVNLSKGVLDTIQLTLVGGALAVLAVLARRWDQAMRHWGEIALVAGPAAGMLALLHIASYRALLDGGTDPLITGRYLVPLLGAFGVGAALVVDALPRRLGAVVAGALLTGLALTSLSGIALTLARTYV